MRVVDNDGGPVPDGEVGEIAIRGHNIMKGYLNKPEATAEVLSADGWFRTGDLGRVDEEGFYYIVDRKKELIIRGGYNVYPREIEEVLYEHPAVAEAAVVGLKHPELGEEVGAAVVLKPGATLQEVAHAFVENGQEFYYVSRDGQTLEGVITMTDLIRGRSAGANFSTSASEFMTKNPIALASDDTCAAAAATIREYRLKSLPIVESKETRKLVGCLRVRRLMGYVVKESQEKPDER